VLKRKKIHPTGSTGHCMPRATPAGQPEIIPSPPTLPELHEVMVRCTRCDLALSRTQVVPGDGSAAAHLLIVGEAPGAREDQQGKPFVGSSGRLLTEMLTLAGIARGDVFIANVVRCRPPENRSPRVGEIRACAGWLREQIRLIDPRVVVVLGRFALQHFRPVGKITELQGRLLRIDYQGRPLGLFPLLHPAAILRAPDRRPAYAALFRRLGEIWREEGAL
jgi:uracil-DNA glycosylase